MTIPGIITALGLGYALGRLRPWGRLGNWADWQVRHRPGRWIGSRARESALFVALAATQPRAAFAALRQVRGTPSRQVDTFTRKK
ncbi:hypothetical protein [Streptomyces sp. NPDC047981]|uniref:hypothetical protein n=1 Tax=Streptomyces sp. NPDC047981 TaxID=3154610 RepID=UPI00342AFA00